ncbi:F/Y rich C-terminus-domain-containing protein [Halteromyces radiatus]|uniref:F/Y rich C-terminus-domain-containing protein n=1 Tax=Halteromyces radiatus TaxID=101107 RepID=UPI00221EAD56|nr:F/Y rich C-terminus-domain-containing protein [Halteromyces radiatus]KAI8092990.1 F/Y rich C-terminus-domain-containing protein [Halteromyces radiatus]
MSASPNTTSPQPTTITTSIHVSINEDKYKKLKRKLREIMGTNDAMLKEYAQTRKKIKSLTYERNLLLDNIARMEHMVSSDDNSSDLPSDLSDSGDDSDVKPTIKSSNIKQQPKVRRRVKKEKIISTSSRDQATVASAPPKRSKMSKVPAKTRRVQPIERDESGNPVLPQQIGVLTVLKLGTIESRRETFHNERYIFPIGYTVSRTYPSMVDPTTNTVITSTILDGGDGPRFHVEAADMPGQPIIANSATGAWTVVVRKSNEIRQRDHSNSASGPDYYGFKHPTIAKMIQDLPGAKELQHYVWQPFEEMEPRAAKGVMAAAEKKRGNLEQMGNANRRSAAAKAAAAKAAKAKTASTSAENGDSSLIGDQEMDDDDVSETATSTTNDAHTSIITPTADDDDDEIVDMEEEEDDNEDEIDEMDEEDDQPSMIMNTTSLTNKPSTVENDTDEEIDELGASD